jgi:hypothetical protein
MNLYTYRTDLRFTVDGGEEQSVSLILRYYVHPGCEPTREQPGEAPYAEISAKSRIHIAGDQYPLSDWMYDFLDPDETLRAELLSNAADADEYGRDQAADARREDRARPPTRKDQL